MLKTFLAIQGTRGIRRRKEGTPRDSQTMGAAHSQVWSGKPPESRDLNDLSGKAFKEILDLAKAELTRVADPKGRKGIKARYYNGFANIRHTIQYLPIPFRFEAISSKLLDEIMEIPPLEPFKPTTKLTPKLTTKLTTKLTITKVLGGMATDAAKTELFNKGRKALLVAGREVYLVTQIGSTIVSQPSTLPESDHGKSFAPQIDTLYSC